MTQLPMFQPASEWTAPALSSLPSWANAQRVGIDIETRDPMLKKLGPGVRRGAYITGVSFAIEDGPAHYLPIRHEGGGNLPIEGVEQYLKDQAKCFKGVIAGANMQYDLDFLAERKIVFRNVSWYRDCQIAEPLLDELQFTYNLEDIAKRYEIPGKNEDALRDAASAWGVHPKYELYKLPAKYVGAYAAQDAILPLQLLRRQERRIDDEGLWDIYNLESKLIPILVKMRRRGVLIDQKKLAHVEQWSEAQEAQCLQKVYDETGVRILVGGVNKPEMLARALEKVGIEAPLTPKTKKPSIKNAFLKGQKHPVADMLLRARKVNKLRTTFAESIRTHMTNGRIHCTFNQLKKNEDEEDEGGKGARYGRLSSSDPNLQQQPSRDDHAALWRSIYIPDGDGLWGTLDYSQQEPKQLIHFAEITGCRGAKEAADKYRTDPTTDNHTMMARIVYGYAENEEPTKVHRTNAKIIFLGLCYSMGGAKLARDLGLPTKWVRNKYSGNMYEAAGDEAQSIINQFNKQAPFVKQLARMVTNKAEKVGFIKTVLGRRCRFPYSEQDKEYMWTHKALNRLIQGSSADQTKKAMVECDAAGHRIQLQVHDEIDLTVESPAHAQEVADIMLNCVPLRIPSKVDVELGPSWGEAA